MTPRIGFVIVSALHGVILMTAHLPEEAREIIARLEAQDRERQYLARARIAQLSEVRNKVSAARVRRTFLKNFTFYNSDSNHTNESASRLRTLKEDAEIEIRDLEAAIKRGLREIERLESSKPAKFLTAARIHVELDAIALDEIVPVDRPTPRLEKGERDLADALPRFRRDVDSLKAERRRVAAAPLTAAAAKAAARRQIERLAARGTPRVMGLFSGGEIAFAQNTSASGHRFLGQDIDGAALLAFLEKEALIQRVEELIDFNSGNFDSPLTAAEREKRLADLDSRIDAAERIEAAAVEALIAQGHEAAQRPDISVCAVLSVAAK